MLFRQLVVSGLLLLVSGIPQAHSADGQLRPAADDAALQSWLQNMVWHHKFSDHEIQQVTGLDDDQLAAVLQRFRISRDHSPQRPTEKMFVLPYPGGRHPRIGFLDGAVDPQRETKLSVFAPWDNRSYAVMDLPEAIWSNLGLTYLAHTHVPTIWSKQNIALPQQEWIVNADGTFESERRLPNGIEFAVKVIPLKDHLRMKMRLTNGTDQPLSDLRVQNCVMLKGMLGFEHQHNDNKRFVNGYAVAGSDDGQRWIISGWDPVHRAWGNAPCPCLHSDPKFADCPPGETRWLRGWFSFFEGTDIDAELQRIEGTGWRKHPLHYVTGNVVGQIRDAESGKLLAAKLTVKDLKHGQYYFATSTAVAGSAVAHTTPNAGDAAFIPYTDLSADGFQLQLPTGRYRLQASAGDDYSSAEVTVDVVDPSKRVTTELKLTKRQK